MSYVDRVLQPGEEVLHRARIHWIVYTPGIIAVLIAIALFIIAETVLKSYGWQHLAVLYSGYACSAIALALLFSEWFNIWTTEIAVTNRRVIYKTGFIRRKTNEMNMGKVENVIVDQSILGRILDYGDVKVQGIGHTGNGEDREIERGGYFKSVRNPLQLRNSITGI